MTSHDVKHVLSKRIPRQLFVCRKIKEGGRGSDPEPSERGDVAIQFTRSVLFSRLGKKERTHTNK